MASRTRGRLSAFLVEFGEAFGEAGVVGVDGMAGHIVDRDVVEADVDRFGDADAGVERWGDAAGLIPADLAGDRAADVERPLIVS